MTGVRTCDFCKKQTETLTFEYRDFWTFELDICEDCLKKLLGIDFEYVRDETGGGDFETDQEE